MQETFELDLKEILGVLLKRIWFISILSITGFALAYSISKFVIPPQYTSSVSLYVNNSSESQVMSAMNINDINASQKLVNTYIVILQDDEVLELVGERLLTEYGAEQLGGFLPLSYANDMAKIDAEGLRNIIKMSAVNNTEVLRITAETKAADLSARICTVMTEVAPDVLMRVVKAGSVEVIGAAKPSDKQSSPNVLLNSLIGFIVGAALSITIVVLMHLLDNTVKDEDGIKKRYNIPILGEIPDFNAQQKGGYSHYGR